MKKYKIENLATRDLSLRDQETQELIICNSELQNHLQNRIGTLVEEGLSFLFEDPKIRGFNPNGFRKTFHLCHEGRIAGGGIDIKSGEWRYTLVGDKKEYSEKELTPYRYATVPPKETIDFLKWLPKSGYVTWDEGKTWFLSNPGFAVESRITPEDLLQMFMGL